MFVFLHSRSHLVPSEGCVYSEQADYLASGIAVGAKRPPQFHPQLGMNMLLYFFSLFIFVKYINITVLNGAI